MLTILGDSLLTALGRRRDYGLDEIQRRDIERRRRDERYWERRW
ncbi:hypothetical protein [Pseudoroseicyclus tamaricis]|nr:hypothetical protein [Pseudoroseicyclus tamaricis]